MPERVLRQLLAEGDFQPGEGEVARLARFVEVAERDRERLGLTAIRGRELFIQRQIIESLALWRLIERRFSGQVRSLVDVGSGGGAPGLPIAIARPELSVTLIEASTSKASWLTGVAAELAPNVTVTPLRAEVAGRQEVYREKFDVAVAKAVAALPTLLELVMPLLRKGGMFFAPKGSRGEEEVARAAVAIRELGAVLVAREALIDDGGGMSVLIFRKDAGTLGRYPRGTAAIVKRPLG